jgi:hypothetical protein
LSRNSGVQVHLQIWKIVTSQTSGQPQPGSRIHLSGEGLGSPFLDGMQNPRLSPQIVGIKDPPVMKTDTQET